MTNRFFGGNILFARLTVLELSHLDVNAEKQRRKFQAKASKTRYLFWTTSPLNRWVLKNPAQN